MVWDFLGILLVVVGAYILYSTIMGIVVDHNRSIFGWLWQILWIGVGGYAVYAGYQRVFPPEPIFPAIPGLTGGYRRRR
jgi:hypothetical protein